ncbi:MAG: hypothetical protein QOE61_1800 [Micromonosporaceae bacterium]|nr:hypothetical protein [Micromonosporaceae bacterium]
MPVQPDDAYWRRPAEDSSPADLTRDPPPENTRPEDSPWAGPGPTGQRAVLPGLVYQGPPPTTPPPAGWRPPHVVEPAPPRRLPEQDHSAIDDQESRARTLTVGLAIVASAVVLIVLCALCGRALF